MLRTSYAVPGIIENTAGDSRGLYVIIMLFSLFSLRPGALLYSS
jgi:hypothetical protein